VVDTGLNRAVGLDRSSWRQEVTPFKIFAKVSNLLVFCARRDPVEGNRWVKNLQRVPKEPSAISVNADVDPNCWKKKRGSSRPRRSRSGAENRWQDKGFTAEGCPVNREKRGKKVIAVSTPAGEIEKRVEGGGEGEKTVRGPLRVKQKSHLVSTSEAGRRNYPNATALATKDLCGTNIALKAHSRALSKVNGGLQIYRTAGQVESLGKHDPLKPRRFKKGKKAYCKRRERNPKKKGSMKGPGWGKFPASSPLIRGRAYT